MAKSSRYLQALFGVIASGRRRKPVYIREQALVSQLYPVFNAPESVAPALSFLAGARLYAPQFFIHDVSPSLSFLAGAVLEDYDPFVNYEADPEIVTPSLSFLVGSSLVDYDPFVNYTHPSEDKVSPALEFRSGGFMYDATIRHTVEPEDFVSPALSFRAGATLTG